MEMFKAVCVFLTFSNISFLRLDLGEHEVYCKRPVMVRKQKAEDLAQPW